MALALGLALLGGPTRAQAETVELQPGTLTGTIAFSSETVQSGSVSANSTDGFSASGSFSGSSYALTVAGAKQWRVSVDCALANPQASTRLAIYRNATADLVAVPAGQSVASDFRYDTARVQAQVSVTGGTLLSHSLWAQAGAWSSTYASASSARSYSSGATAGAGVLPMLSGQNVRVGGTAVVRTSGGQQISVALAEQIVSLSASGAEVTWSVEVGQLDGAVRADFALEPAQIVSQHQVQLSGVGGTPTAGVSRSASRSGNGLIQLTELVPGRYYPYLYTYFTAPYYYLRHPTPAGLVNGQLEVTAGAETSLNVSGNLAFVHGTLRVSGFLTQSQLVQGYVYADGVGGQATAGGFGYDYTGSDGRYDLALTAGPWSLYRWQAGLQDSTDPARPVTTSLYAQDYTRHPSYGGTPLRLNGGEEVSGLDLPVNTTRGEVIFDVAEAQGQPAILIAQPTVSGYAYQYDSQGRPTAYRYFSSTRNGAAQAQPSVVLAAEPGLYNATASAYVNGNSVVFARFTLELRQPIQTPAGQNVTVQPSDSVSLTFADVTSPGITTVTEVPVGPTSPAGFRINAPGGQPIFYDISTTATFSGPVELCFDYVDTDDGTATDIPANKEKNLKLFHYETRGGWTDITRSLDLVHNRICGVTSGFSIFAIVSSTDPTIASLEVPAGPLLTGATVLARATFSDDDPQDAHTAEWNWGDGTTSNGVVDESAGTVTASHTYTRSGRYTVTLRLVDLAGNAVTASGPTVINQPPVAHAGADQVVAAQANCQTAVPLDGTGSHDDDGDPLSYRWSWTGGEAEGPTPVVTLPLGRTTLTLTVSDGLGGIASDTVEITVEDRTAPTLGPLTASPNLLWPPNHLMVPVTIDAAVVDACDAGARARIVAVASNEPVNGLGDGDTAPDWEIAGDLTVLLRAERSGTGNGRLYTLTVEAQDAAGNRTTRTVLVAVPHSQPKRSLATK